MGSSLAITAVALERPVTELDWDAGRAALTSVDLTPVRETWWAEMNEVEDDTPDSDIAEWLAAEIDTLRTAIEEHWRNITYLTVDRTQLLLTAGDGGGDETVTTALEVLLELDAVLAAIGLRSTYQPPTDPDPDQLYDDLLARCEQDGIVTDHTRELLDQAIESINTDI